MNRKAEQLWQPIKNLPREGLAAEIPAGLANRGEPMRYGDAPLAGVAKPDELVLVTRNVRHFASVGARRVENWFTTA